MGIFFFFFAFLKFTFTLSLSSFFFLFRFLHIVIRLTKEWSLIYLDQFIFNGYKKQIIVNLRLIKFILHSYCLEIFLRVIKYDTEMRKTKMVFLL